MNFHYIFPKSRFSTDTQISDTSDQNNTAYTPKVSHGTKKKNIMFPKNTYFLLPRLHVAYCYRNDSLYIYKIYLYIAVYDMPYSSHILPASAPLSTELLAAWMGASPWMEAQRVASPWMEALRVWVVTPAVEVRCRRRPPLMRLHQSHQFHSVSLLQLHLSEKSKGFCRVFSGSFCLPRSFKSSSVFFLVGKKNRFRKHIKFKHHGLQNHFTSRVFWLQSLELAPCSEADRDGDAMLILSSCCQDSTPKSVAGKTLQIEGESTIHPSICVYLKSLCLLFFSLSVDLCLCLHPPLHIHLYW